MCNFVMSALVLIGLRACVYIHSYIHTYIQVYIHAYIHVYIHAYINVRIHACIHVYIYVRLYIHICATCILYVCDITDITHIFVLRSLFPHTDLHTEKMPRTKHRHLDN